MNRIEMTQSRKFKGLEGMRLFAFINIFLLHTSGFKVINYYQSASWAVSFFFILGGFLYGFKYSNKKIIMSSTLRFTWRKILKFWPLHFFTTILMFGYSGMFIKRWIDLLEDGFVKKLILNLSLLQSWSMDGEIYYGFTGVSWYLSDLMFLTLLTIPILWIVNKYLINLKRLMMALIIVVMSAWLYFKIITTFSNNPAYFLYVFPPCRLFEYISGIILGKILFIKDNCKNNNAQMIIFTIIEVVIFGGLIFHFQDIEGLIPEAWRSTIFIIPNCILIYIFALERGIVSKFVFGNRIMVILGGYVFDAFLLHQVVNVYFSNAIGAVPGLPIYTCIRAEIYILLICFTFAYLRNNGIKKQK